VGGAHSQALAVDRLDDFSGQDGLKLLGVCVLMSQIAEDIPAAPTTSSFFFIITTSPSSRMGGRKRLNAGGIEAPDRLAWLHFGRAQTALAADKLGGQKASLKWSIQPGSILRR